MNTKKLRRGLCDPLLGAGIALAGAGIGRLSYARLGRVSRHLARLAARLAPGTTDLIRTNLRIAFPDWPKARVDAVCSENLRNMTLTSFEFLWFNRAPERLEPMVDADAPETRKLFEECHAAHGAMLVTPHLGNWELLGQAAAVHGVRLNAVAHAIRNRWLQQLVTRARHYHGMEIIPEHGAARGMLRALRAGKPIGILMDQNTRPHQGGVFVDFFGLPAATTRAPATLARRLKLLTVVGACVREQDRLCIRVVRLPRPAADYPDDASLTQALTAAQEQLIRRYPEQYVWSYRRWRYIPESADNQLRARFPAYAREYRRPADRAS